MDSSLAGWHRVINAESYATNRCLSLPTTSLWKAKGSCITNGHSEENSLCCHLCFSLPHWNKNKKECGGSVDMTFLSSEVLPHEAVSTCSLHSYQRKHAHHPGQTICGQKALAYPPISLKETGPKCQPGLRGLVQNTRDPRQAPVSLRGSVLGFSQCSWSLDMELDGSSLVYPAVAKPSAILG